MLLAQNLDSVFQEHVKYLNGECLVDDCVDYYSVSIENEKDLEEFNKSINGEYTMADVEDGWIDTYTFDSSSLDYQVEALLNVYKKLRRKRR